MDTPHYALLKPHTDGTTHFSVMYVTNKDLDFLLEEWFQRQENSNYRETHNWSGWEACCKLVFSQDDVDSMRRGKNESGQCKEDHEMGKPDTRIRVTGHPSRPDLNGKEGLIVQMESGKQNDADRKLVVQLLTEHNTADTKVRIKFKYTEPVIEDKSDNKDYGTLTSYTMGRQTFGEVCIVPPRESKPGEIDAVKMSMNSTIRKLGSSEFPLGAGGNYGMWEVDLDVIPFGVNNITGRHQYHLNNLNTTTDGFKLIRLCGKNATALNQKVLKACKMMLQDAKDKKDTSSAQLAAQGSGGSKHRHNADLRPEERRDDVQMLDDSDEHGDYTLVGGWWHHQAATTTFCALQVVSPDSLRSRTETPEGKIFCVVEANGQHKILAAYEKHVSDNDQPADDFGEKDKRVPLEHAFVGPKNCEGSPVTWKQNGTVNLHAGRQFDLCLGHFNTTKAKPSITFHSLWDNRKSAKDNFKDMKDNLHKGQTFHGWEKKQQSWGLTKPFAYGATFIGGICKHCTALLEADNARIDKKTYTMAINGKQHTLGNGGDWSDWLKLGQDKRCTFMRKWQEKMDNFAFGKSSQFLSTAMLNLPMIVKLQQQLIDTNTQGIGVDKRPLDPKYFDAAFMTEWRQQQKEAGKKRKTKDGDDSDGEGGGPAARGPPRT